MKSIVSQKLSPSLVFLPIVSPLKLSSSLVACNCFFEKVFELVFETKLIVACEQVRASFLGKSFPREMTAPPPKKFLGTRTCEPARRLSLRIKFAFSLLLLK